MEVQMKIVAGKSKSELELLDNTVVIRKQGFANAMASGLNGERSIPISTITAIQLKLGGWTPGYILFSYAGSKPFAGGIFEATHDPDAFLFEKSHNDEVSAFKTKVEQLMRESRKSPSTTSTASLAEEIRKLSALKDEGILSQDEFDSAKRRLLSP
jgi:hypothetical protein